MILSFLKIKNLFRHLFMKHSGLKFNYEFIVQRNKVKTFPQITQIKTRKNFVDENQGMGVLHPKKIQNLVFKLLFLFIIYFLVFILNNHLIYKNLDITDNLEEESTCSEYVLGENIKF